MRKCSPHVQQREKAFGVSFRVRGLLVAPEPTEGNVGSCARVKSIECAVFRRIQVVPRLLRPEHMLGAFLIISAYEGFEWQNFRR